MPRLLDHIDIRVRDLDACANFYRSLLPLIGFTEQVAIEGWIQFEGSGPGVTEFFGITEDRDHQPNRSRIAFWADSAEKIDQIAARLAAFGALNIEPPEWEVPTYYAVYFEDPSGNPLEICYRSKKFSET